MKNKKFNFIIKIIIIFLCLFSIFFYYLLKNNVYFIFSNCNIKTISFERIYKYNSKYTSIYSNNSYYNLTFFSEMNEDQFRVEKLKTLGFKNHMKLGVYNLYILPYIMEENLEYIISKFIISKYQKINMYFNYKDYCSKSLLYFNYEKMQKLFPLEYNYMLETFSYPENKDIIEKRFVNYSYNKDDVWLLKPKLSLAGNGISILRNYTDIKQDYIVTKYLTNPHIIKGVKYDIRFHGLITSVKPLILYLYDEGLARLATEKYDYNDQTNIYSFLTNLHVNINNKNKFIYPQNNSNIEDSHLWNLETLKKYFTKNNINYDIIYEQVKDIFIKMIFTVRQKIINSIEKYGLSNSNFYHLIGFDIILDENLKPYLLEANRKAGFRDDNDAEKGFTFNLIIDTINLVGIKRINNKIKTKNNDENKEVENYICELNKSYGGYNLIFPLRKKIEKYKKFFLNDISDEDLKLWNYLNE